MKFRMKGDTFFVLLLTFWTLFVFQVYANVAQWTDSTGGAWSSPTNWLAGNLPNENTTMIDLSALGANAQIDEIQSFDSAATTLVIKQGTLEFRANFLVGRIQVLSGGGSLSLVSNSMSTRLIKQYNKTDEILHFCQNATFASITLECLNDTIQFSSWVIRKTFNHSMDIRSDGLIFNSSAVLYLPITNDSHTNDTVVFHASNVFVNNACIVVYWGESCIKREVFIGFGRLNSSTPAFTNCSSNFKFFYWDDLPNNSGEFTVHYRSPDGGQDCDASSSNPPPPSSSNANTDTDEGLIIGITFAIVAFCSFNMIGCFLTLVLISVVSSRILALVTHSSSALPPAAAAVADPSALDWGEGDVAPEVLGEGDVEIPQMMPDEPAPAADVELQPIESNAREQQEGEEVNNPFEDEDDELTSISSGIV